MSGEVRLACAGDAETFVASSSGAWIALPAAEFKAWRRVVEASMCWWITPQGDEESERILLDACFDLYRLRHDQQPGRAGGVE